mmetsp:Transcript_3385/g.4965  ORF Transcript_3385/g.4965 Transcript_3385/m.4965 type:complete len:205 (+) Transcript_3385:137-751(+)
MLRGVGRHRLRPPRLPPKLQRPRAVRVDAGFGEDLRRPPAQPTRRRPLAAVRHRRAEKLRVVGLHDHVRVRVRLVVAGGSQAGGDAGARVLRRGLLPPKVPHGRRPSNPGNRRNQLHGGDGGRGLRGRPGGEQMPRGLFEPRPVRLRHGDLRLLRGLLRRQLREDVRARGAGGQPRKVVALSRGETSKSGSAAEPPGEEAELAA